VRESFLRDMKLIYPDGVDNREQHRDLVRTYSMGWVSSLMEVGNREAIEKWVKDFAYLSKPGWWPDLSWEWNLPEKEKP